MIELIALQHSSLLHWLAADELERSALLTVTPTTLAVAIRGSSHVHQANAVREIVLKRSYPPIVTELATVD